MKIVRMLLLGGAVIQLCFIAGCAGMSYQPTSVIFQNPTTMEFVQCDVGQWGTKASYAKNEQCVEEYKRQGFVVWAKR
jgi:hypothetical protein